VVAAEKRGWEVAGCREVEKVRRREVRLLFLRNSERISQLLKITKVIKLPIDNLLNIEHLRLFFSSSSNGMKRKILGIICCTSGRQMGIINLLPNFCRLRSKL